MTSSLFLTHELLNKYNAEGEDIAFLKENYPNGIFLSQIFSDEVYDFSMEIIHWIYVNLPLTKKDKEDYLHYVEIYDSYNFYRAFHIKKCNFIADSIFCTDSSYIFDSSHVDESVGIFYSEDISRSVNVINSHLINDSNNIYNSTHVDFSNNIFNSKHIKNSQNIAFGKDISFSKYLVSCKSTIEAYLSRNLTNCKNKLLCFDLNDNTVPMILNQEVSNNRFIALKSSLLAALEGTNLLQLPEVSMHEGNLAEVREALSMVVLPLEINELTLFHEFFNRKNVINLIKRNIPDFNKDLLYQLSYSEGVYQ